MSGNHKTLLEGPIIHSLLRLALPTVAANILQTGYQIVDAFWVGRLGAAAVAAVAISFPLTFFIIAIGGGLGVAGATLVAQNHGARNVEMVGHVVAQTYLLVATVSVLLSIAGIFLTPFILTKAGVAPDVYAAARGFLRISFVAIIFVFGLTVFQAIMRSVGRAMVPLYITMLTVALNFTLDPLFIFGWHRFPALGVKGAALATLLTQMLGMAIALAALARGRYGIRLHPSSFRPDFRFMKRAIGLGFPASLELSARTTGLMALSFLVARFGTLTMASYGVGSNLLQIVTVPAIGFSSSCAALIGQNIGAGNIERAGRVAMLGALLGFGILSCAGAVAFASAPYLAAFFVPGNPQVIVHAANFLRIMSPSWGFVAVQLCFIAAFRASGNMWTAMVLGFVWQCVLQFPSAYLLSVHTRLGMNGLWWSFPLTNLITASIAYAWFARGGWNTTRLLHSHRS